MSYLRKKCGSSIIHIGTIACDLILGILILGINRVIEPSHVLLTVLSNIHLKVTVRAELGLLKRIGDVTAAPENRMIFGGGIIMNSKLLEKWASNTVSIFKFYLEMSKYIWLKITKGRVRKNNCMSYL